MTVVATEPLVRAASLAELRATGRLVVHVERHTLCLFADGDEVYAVDNRCPHMGFPLHRGTLCDGILTCHWHHARFELSTGGTFDQWADDLRGFPVELRGDDVLLDLSALEDLVEHQRKRLRDGLERDIPLVLAKATLALLKADPAGIATFCDGLDFGVARRGGGWFRGLTTLTCLMNLLPRLVQADRAAALHHGLADVAADSAGEPPRFRLAPLPGRVDPVQLTRWFRGFIEVRDAEGAEGAPVDGWTGRDALVESVLGEDPAASIEALLTALRDGASEVELASAVSFAAVIRIARFPTSNEFGDWDTALHTFTFANAVEQGLRRSPSPELLRGVLDAAMSVHLDRFLNVPATRLPEPDGHGVLTELPLLLDGQQRVD